MGSASASAARGRGRLVVGSLLALATTGCGYDSSSSSVSSSSRSRDETVLIEMTSSPTRRQVKVSVTGDTSAEISGTTPLTREVSVRVDCGGGNKLCILGHASFDPLVNDPSAGTLTLCLSAFDERACDTSTGIVFVAVGP